MHKIIKFFKENKLICSILIGMIAFYSFSFIYNKYEAKMVELEKMKDVEMVEKEKYQSNEFHIIRQEKLDILELYYEHYIYLTKNDIEEAFSLLTDYTKSKFSNSIDEYKEYINGKNYTDNMKLLEYRKKNDDKYEVYDNKSFKYVIYENGIWNYKIELV